MREIQLDQLTNYSKWPKRLIGLESSPKIIKSESEVIREFEIETWGSIRNSSKGKLMDIDSVEDRYFSLDYEMPFFYKGKFYITTNKNILNKHIGFYHDTLSKYIDNSTALVEFGAGFGSKIIRLAKHDIFRNIPKYAGELTESGQELISAISKEMSINIEVGKIDLRRQEISGLSLPKRALIFTSYASHYDPCMNVDFVKFLKSFEPSAVVNFEPCCELYSEKTIHGLMCKKYISTNDYTSNIWSTIRNHCEDSGLNLNCQSNILGYNPFMPISSVEWGW